MDPIKSIENAAALDSPIEKVGGVASKVLPQGPVKDALCGTWLGHPLHPMLTDLPIGFWLGSLVVDVVGGRSGRAAADRLLAIGSLAALPTAASGLSDWIDTYGDERRVGFVHAAGNLAALGLFTGSSLARRRGRRATGFLLSVAGAACVSASGFLGGHLSFRLGAGVDHTRFEHPPEDWTPAMPVAEIQERTPTFAQVNGADVMIYKDADRICAIANRCSHRAGPLHEGTVDGARRTVTCPWHASEFDLDTGAVVRGPAVAGQPVYETRINGDHLEVKAAG
ncbi:MAG TPA: Rieske 2Fe-2S domain-containing protein [Actinomycetota bacterium]|nr:Rieske 2Fe-2S domain-containing protein [Actinomycetota bacterium]